MEEQTVVMTNGDHSVIMDEVETIKQVDVETSTVAETRDRSMSAGDTPGQCESVRMLEQLMQQHKTVYRYVCVWGGHGGDCHIVLDLLAKLLHYIVKI